MPSLCAENCTRLTNVVSGTPGKLAVFVHDLPSFCVTWISPSSVPTASRPARRGDSDTVEMLLNSAVPSCSPSTSRDGTVPRMGRLSRSTLRVRSGLIVVHESPRSALLNK